MWWKKPGLVALLILVAVGLLIRFWPELIPSLASRDITSNTMPDSEVYYLVEGSVYDGDTLRVKRCGEQCEDLKIRLCGIDAPEMDQPMSAAARNHLRSLINQGDGTLLVLPVEQDRYGRTVAEIFVPVVGQESEIHLTSQMVMDGYAYHYERYSGGCPNGQLLAGVEEQARSLSAGVCGGVEAIGECERRAEAIRAIGID
ncbi:MAG: thermonuclease family protein [Leptolyngbyaceae cyanobacterium]